MATTVARLEAILSADTRDFRRGMDDADDKFTKSTKKFGMSTKLWAGAGAVAAAGVAGVVAGLKSSLSAAKDAEAAQARLKSALDNAGVSFDKYGGSIDAAIQKTSMLAAIDDEDLSDSFAQLIRVTGDVQKATEGMSLAADIARARNISLAAATKMVERAQAGNEGAFGRIGIKLRKNQDATDALRIATERYGGAAEHYGKTAAGAQDRLGVAFENLQEKIGQKLLPVMVKLSEALLKLIVWVEREWPKWERAIRDGVATARRIFEDFRPVLEAVAKQIENVVKLVAAIFRGDWAEAWEKFKDVIAGGLNLARALLFEWVEKMRALGELIGKALKAGISAGIQGLADLLVGIVRSALNAVIGLWNRLRIPGFTIDPPGPGKISWGGFDFPDIPQLAEGGIITKPTLALIGERGPEAVMPLKDMGGDTYVFNFPQYVGDRRELEQAVRDALAVFQRRNAKAAI